MPPTVITKTRRDDDPPSRIPTLADRVDVALGEIEDILDEDILAGAAASLDARLDDIEATAHQHAVPITVTAGASTRGYCPWPAGHVVAGIDVVASVELTSAADGAVINVDGVGHAQEVVDADSVVGVDATPAALAIETHTAPETDKALVLILTAGADVEGGADFTAIVRYAIPAE